MKFLFAILLFFVAQILAWFQSNSGILEGPFKDNYILIALVLGPIVSVIFAYATVLMYETMPLWSIRFITFSLGYLIFIPLTWYFLGEEIFTLKNIVSFTLCVLLMCTQFFME